MVRCDVVIAGGGPAGAACAWKLRRAGVDVIVLERATFPRDKPCAGWITPQVLDDLQIDISDYQHGRTLQPITGFRIGVMGADRDTLVAYGRPVSFGVRRCEFDQYLLTRAGARVNYGAPIRTARRDGRDWIINDDIRAPMLVGAGGHFCRVAAHINGPPNHGAGVQLVVAQEAEFRVEPEDTDAVAADVPEFYFTGDFRGYGWCCRKQGFLNVGYGRQLDPPHCGVTESTSVKGAVAGFVHFAVSRGRLANRENWPWRGHAYLLNAAAHRRVTDDGLLLAGDAAGLAYPQSGEGIRPAIESGLFAAETIVEAAGNYSRDNLGGYEARLSARFGWGSRGGGVASRAPASLVNVAGRALLGIPWFVRSVVLDRWFLHAGERALSA